MTSHLSASSHQLLVAWLLVWLVVCGDCCSPGRGYYNRRRRGDDASQSPLVLKQHLPNVQETSAAAAGGAEGRMLRDDARMLQLVPNYNPDVVFKDDEGTGADRIMTARASALLNVLAVAVMNQWPGVRVRVINAWSESGILPRNSLHYEGRALDLTTSDRDQSKLGLLARLAVNVGFDWVSYASNTHVHCSVKSESKLAFGLNDGCFSGDNLVTTANKSRIGINQLSVNNITVQTLDQQGELISSPVITWLDRQPARLMTFIRLSTARGHRLTVTPGHLVFVVKCGHSQVTTRSQCQVDDTLNTTRTVSFNAARRHHACRSHKKNHNLDEASAIYAADISVGDCLVTQRDNSLARDPVTHVKYVTRRGLYAPLTETGTMLVGGVWVSCYAVTENHATAHQVMAPLRWAHKARAVWCSVVPCQQDLASNPTDGVHWYGRLLWRLATVLV